MTTLETYYDLLKRIAEHKERQRKLDVIELELLQLAIALEKALKGDK